MRPKTIIKYLLPTPVLRRLQKSHRNLVFRRAIKKYLKDVDARKQPGNTVINDLIYGWGNEGWSASNEYLTGCIQHAMNTNGSILECGTGLSTILIGAVAKRRGVSHWALEHSSDWANKVRKILHAYEIDSVVLCSKPLLDYGDFAWYDPPLKSMPKSFDLVVCDGPPGTTKGGRRGLVAIMGRKLQMGTVILLDDVIRPDERRLAKQWASELEASLESHGLARPYIKLTVLNDQH